MKRDENGYIVVETVGCFVLFVLLITSILSIINIVTVQARVHYAISQTAQTISMYTYALEKTGLADPLMGVADRADSAQGEIDTFKNNVNGILDALDGISSAKGFDDVYNSGNALWDSGKNLYEQGEELSNRNPKELLQDFIDYGVDQANSQLLQIMLRSLMNRYLANGEMSGDEYLKAYNVIDGIHGLKFAALETFDLSKTGNNNSRLLTVDGDVRIRVTYKIDYTFGALPLPFTELTITQEAVTKAWLSGQGEGYK